MISKFISYIQIFLAIVASPDLAAKSKDEAPLVIYVAGSFTGIMPFLADGIYNAAQSFADQVNKEGGLLGRDIIVRKQDDQADVIKASVHAKAAIDDPNQLVTVGHPFSSVAIPIGKMYAKHNKLMFTPYATSTEVSAIKGTVFQLCFNDDFQGKTLAHIATKKLKGRRILVLRNISDPYSDGLASSFLTQFASSGKEGLVSIKEFHYVFDKIKYPELLSAISSFNPDVIFLPELKVRAADIVKTIRSSGIYDPQILGADGWGTEDGSLDIFFSGIKPRKTGRYLFTYHWHPDIDSAENRRIKSALKNSTGKEAYGPAVLTYEGLSRLRAAVSKMKTIDGEKLAKELRGQPFNGTTGSVTYGADGITRRHLVLLELTKDGLRFDSLVRQSNE